RRSFHRRHQCRGAAFGRCVLALCEESSELHYPADRQGDESARDQLGRRNHHGYLPDQRRSGCASVAPRRRQLMEAAAVDPFVFRLAIFVLAIFVGYYVVWSVTPALHT